MIVVEGCDGAGKSTLVRWICNEFGLEEGHRRTSNRDEIYRTTRIDTYAAIYNELMCDFPARVWDRLGAWSDPIYAPLMGRECAFSHRELNAISMMMSALACPLIVCLPKFAAVEDNVRRTHQIKAASEHIDKIYSAYSDLRGVTLFFNYERDDFQSVKHTISKYLQRRKEREDIANHSGSLQSRVGS
jgi:hypothetical protein